MLPKLCGVILLALMLMMTIAGCHDKRELGDLALILGIGIDAGENGDLLMTAELAYQRQSADTGESMLVSVSGNDFAELEAELMRKIEKYPYWGNLAALVFGPGLSAAQCRELALTLYRDARVGPGIILLAAEGSAADIFGGSFGEADYVALGLTQAMSRREQQRQIALPTVAEYLEALLAQGKDAAAPEPELPRIGVNAAGEVYLGGAYV